jgi:hypothetical protein
MSDTVVAVVVSAAINTRTTTTTTTASQRIVMQRPLDGVVPVFIVDLIVVVFVEVYTPFFFHHDLGFNMTTKAVNRRRPSVVFGHKHKDNGIL